MSQEPDHQVLVLADSLDALRKQSWKLAVDQQVDVALVGSDAGVVWETILAPTRSRRTSEA